MMILRLSKITAMHLFILLSSIALSRAVRLYNVSRLPTSAAQCKTVQSLAQEFAKTHSAVDALRSWCDTRTSSKARGGSCPLCLGQCEHKGSVEQAPEVFLHWTLTKSGELDKVMLGDRMLKANVGQSRTCLTAQIRGESSHLKVLGAYKKELVGVCLELPMKTVARIYVAILKALGVQQFHSQDESHFGKCGADKTGIPSFLLKIVTKGRSLYSAYFGDAFSFNSDGCETIVEQIRSFTFAKPDIVQQATKLLNLTQLPEEATLCQGLLDKHSAFVQRLSSDLDIKPILRGDCADFTVNVPSAISCGDEDEDDIDQLVDATEDYLDTDRVLNEASDSSPPDDELQSPIGSSTSESD